MFSRHDLAWLSPAGWNAARAAVPGHDEAFSRWQREDWPAVVRRRDAGAGADTVCLGLALAPDPVDARKRRISLQALKSDVVRTSPALALPSVIDAAPAAWQRGLLALELQARGLRLRVYGSLALQTLTRAPYVTPNSDIDLLFDPATRSALDAGLALLAAHGAHLPLDGELVFPSGAAVAWKEWIGARRNKARVLVKDNDAVRLADTESLLATLAP
jgi:phosphoribosyl-dephospho-CoA transferase